ncbi:MAG: hypothetical protein ACFFC7_10675 [Candidatus Hermodarchaeota archaeon]
MVQAQPYLLNMKPIEFFATKRLNLGRLLQIINYLANKETSLSTDDVKSLSQMLTLSTQEFLSLIYFGYLIECLKEDKEGNISLTPLGWTLANITGKKGEPTPLARAMLINTIFTPNLKHRSLKAQFCLKLLQDLCSGYLLDRKLNVKHVANQSSVFVSQNLLNYSKINLSLLIGDLGMLTEEGLSSTGCIWNSQLEINSTIADIFDLYNESLKPQILIAVKRTFGHLFRHRVEYNSTITEDMSLLLTGIKGEVLIKIISANHLLQADDLLEHSNCVIISYGLAPGAEESLDLHNIRFIPVLSLFEFYHTYRIQLEQLKDHFSLRRFRFYVASLIETFLEEEDRIWSESLVEKLKEAAQREKKRTFADISVERIEQWIFTVLPVLPRIKPREFKQVFMKLEDSLMFDPEWRVEPNFVLALQSLSNIGTSKFGNADYYLVNLMSPIVARSRGLTGSGAQILLLDDPNPYIALIYREIIYDGGQSVQVLAFRETISNAQQFGNKTLTILEEALGSHGKFPRYGFTVISEIDDPANPHEVLSPWEMNKPFLQTCLKRLRVALTHPEHTLIGALNRDLRGSSSSGVSTNILVPLDIEQIEQSHSCYYGWILFTSEGLLGNRNAPFTFHPDIVLQLYIGVSVSFFSTILSNLLTEINDLRLNVDYYHQTVWRLLYESASGKETSEETFEQLEDSSKRNIFRRRRKEHSPRTITEILAALNNRVRPKLQEMYDTLSHSSLEEDLSFIQNNLERIRPLIVFSENNQFPSFAEYEDFNHRFVNLLSLKEKTEHAIQLIENQIATLTEVIELYLNERSKRILEWLTYLTIVSVLGEVVASSYIFTLITQSGIDPLPSIGIIASALIVGVALLVITIIILLKVKDKISG